MRGISPSTSPSRSRWIASSGGKKVINISFDEWNVWYHSNAADQKIEPWSTAPPPCTTSRTSRPCRFSIDLEVELRGMGTYRVVEHVALTHEDPKATNTAEEPNRVVPRVLQGATAGDARVRAALPRLSWNTIRLRKAQPS